MAITVQQFIERLTESGLMSAAEVARLQDSLPPDKRPKDVQQLAQALVQHGKLTKYQAQAVYQGKAKGLVFGEYTVLDQIGEGGMGVVLKARHRRMKRTVAIKVLPPAAMKQAGAVERFHREVQAAAQLSHPNIVTAYDAGEHHGMYYLAMEYVEGHDLATAVKEHGPLEVRQAVECILQAARGLQYAHEQGIIHRDIKPGNLLLDKKGTVKILDMGLARIAGPDAVLGGAERLTTSGQALGTCDYMAPEQALDTHAADHRADIYALGCTLYRLLTGSPPYQAESFAKLFLLHLEAPIPSLRAARPEATEALDSLYQRMLAKKPEDRCQSMADVVAELEAVLAFLSGRSRIAPPEPPESSSAALSQTLAFLQESRPAGTAVAPPKATVEEETHPGVSRQDTGTNILVKARRVVAKVRQKPLLLAAVAGGLVLLLGIVLTITLGHGGRRPGTGYSVPGAQSSVPSTAYSVPSTAYSVPSTQASGPIPNPQSPIPRPSPPAPSPSPGPQKADWQPKPLEQGGPLEPAALVVEPAKIRGLRSWTIETPHVRDGWLAFNNYASIESSPDGRYLLAARPTAVRVLDAKTLQTVRILLPTEAWSASWSPDGRLVAIGGRGPEGQPAVRLWDVQSGKIAHCLKLSASASADQVSVCWSPDGRKLGVARRGGGWSISFWDVERGVRLKEYGPEPTGLGPFVFLPDGKTIACAAATGRPNELAVKLLDVATLEPQRSLGVGSDRVGLRLSPDGSLLVGPGPGGKWGILRCWRVADGSVAYDLDAGDRALSATLRFSRDGKLLAVGGRIYDALTGKPLKTLPQRADNRDAQVVALDFSTDGRQLAALYQDHRLVLWDLGTMQMAGSLGGHGGLACPLRFARKGSALAWRDSSQYVHVFRTGQKETLVSFASAKLPNRFQVGTFDLDISPDGQYVREFGTVWDAATGKIIEKGGGKGGQYDIPGRWSPDNQLLVKKDYRIVGIGDPVHGTVREFAKPLAGDARSAWQFSPDGSRLLQMADTVRLFDGASGDLLREIAADKIRGVAWAADGKSIRWMVGGGDKGWLVSDGPTGKPSHKLAGVGWIAGIDFAPSRGLVAVGTDKGNVLLAEVATGKTVSLLDTQVRSDTSPAFTGDDRRLWVGGMNLVRQWDVETARPVVTLLPIEGNRFALISPEGHYRGSPGIEDQLLYVALTDEGEYLTLSGPEFEKQYGWKNDPAKVASP